MLKLKSLQILAAGAAVVGGLGAAGLGAAGLSSSAEAAVIGIRLGPNPANGPRACRFVHRPAVSRHVVRQRLRNRGFHHIRNIRFVPGYRIGPFRCKPGRFVSTARRGRFVYRVNSSITGRPYYAYRRAVAIPRPGPVLVGPGVVRVKLIARGYRFVRVVGVRFRFGRRVYVSYANKFGRRFVVYSSVRTGAPIRRRMI